MTVDSTGGAVAIPITYDGGTGANSLTLSGGTATSDSFTPGPGVGAGTSQIVLGGITQTVSFLNLLPVLDTVSGPLTVSGNPSSNTINYTVGSVPANGLVAVSSAAVLAVYSAGYVRTRAAAEQMEGRSEERRPAPPLPVAAPVQLGLFFGNQVATGIHFTPSHSQTWPVAGFVTC